MTLTEKILESHLVSGSLTPGSEISIRIDQTLTQDSTGTMAYLQLEAMGIGRVRTRRSVAYVDHNMLQGGFENADDHKYIQTVAKKHGIWFSRPGNGVCHQVTLERFAVPGETLIGSDSHTPTAGGIGMLAFGAGGLDVAMAMGGGAYMITMPEVVNVRLLGKLSPGVSAKDIILEVLRRVGVKGGVSKILEYTGGGASLSVPERATITNMGAECGATTSLFPSDDITLAFLKAQNREADFVPLAADPDAVYSRVIDIDLDTLEPLVAAPHSPDNVKKAADCGDIAVDQVIIGGCTNGSYTDFVKAAEILNGRTLPESVSLVISPGSKQVLAMLAESGLLSIFLKAGARLLEPGCGPCIGMGQAPATNAVSLRTFNRNFPGRCGTKSAEVWLSSPEVAAASAVTGRITDPRVMQIKGKLDAPRPFVIDDGMIVSPDGGESTAVVRGPNIKPFPMGKPVGEGIRGKALIVVGDNITTDHIAPAGAKLLPFRSNIPYLSDFCLAPCDETFPARARAYDGGFIIAGENYGQGSSREHAALIPLQLGIKAVLAKSFARIHKANLINAGILPLQFRNPADYDRIAQMDELNMDEARKQIEAGSYIKMENETRNEAYELTLDVTPFERAVLLAGGRINHFNATQKENASK